MKRFTDAQFVSSTPRRPEQCQRLLSRKIAALSKAQALLSAAIVALRRSEHDRGIELACDVVSAIDPIFCD